MPINPTADQQVSRVRGRRRARIDSAIRPASGGVVGARLRMLMAGFLLCAAAICTAQSTQPASALKAQLDKVVILAQQGDAEQAQSLLDALLKDHPESVPALKVQGMLLEHAGRAAEASLVYRKALQLAPLDPALLFQVGLDALTAGDRDQAIELLQRGLNVAPGNAQALYYLALSYHQRHDEALALKTMRDCLALQPDNPLVAQKYGEFLANSGDNAEAEKWLLKAQAADPNLKRIYFDIAVASFRNSDLPTADRFATLAAESQPADLDALRVLARAKEALSQPQDARAVFERIVAARPDDVASLLGLGQCALELKDYPAAVDTLERVLQLDPAEVNAHFFLARALNGVGRAADARHEAELHRILLRQNSFNPSKDQLQREQAILDQVVQLLLDNREDEALRLAQAEDQGNSTSPGRGDTILASIYLSMHRFDDAQRLLQHALKLDPKTPDTHAYLGELALLQDDLTGAEEGFQAELALSPHHTLAMAELGEVRYRQQRWADAAELLSDSRTTTPRLLYLLCDAYFRLGKIPSANLAAETVAAYAKDAPGVMDDIIALLKRNGQAELAKRLAGNGKR